MKTLYLVRHAKSSWDFPGLADFDRPLNGRGKRNAPEMGARLRSRSVKPDLLISSPAKRAYGTAKRIAEEIAYSKDKIQTNKLIYHGSEANLLEVIRSQNNNINSVMLFGHNPGFTDLANVLSDDWFDNIPTCGIVAIQFEIENWKEVQPKKGKVIFYDYPKKPFL
ncbi:histidine phosphatase family protein [Fulvivirgaceae bacterium BMA10]|uniref:Histidine phosphatase family protein n=1 Tax=Splendidivirga corallicola TaxID=3051826 RepID=A0ABT8KJD0_9BACT|nr:histidine phosphatase family protein [Fulvivirgaceae bacterium BMA10]